MSKALYIIGNGFDKAHGLKTSYWDFRTYLESTHWEFLQALEKLYSFEPLDDLDPYVPEGAKLRWEKMLQGELWSRLEDNMGHPNIAQMENFSDCIVNDLDLDSGNVGIRDTLDEYWRREYGFIKKLQGYIKEWIESLDTTKIKPRKKVLIKSTDYFFSFNYTDTLESVYKITDVFHVHGGIDSICDREPIMGHCNREQIKEYREKAVEADNLWDEGAASIDDAIADYLEETYKDTAQIIWLCDYFWHRLSDIRTAFKEYKTYGADLYKEALTMLAKGWEGDPDSLRSGILQGMVRFVALYQGEYDPERLVKRLHTVHPMTLVNDEKSLSGTVSYKYMMLILRTYNGASRRFNLPIKQ